MSTDYEDEYDRIAHQALVEKHLKRYNTFIEGHSTRVLAVLEKCRVYPEENDENAVIDALTSIQPFPRMAGKAKININSAAAVVNAYGLTHHVWDYGIDPIQLSSEPSELIHSNGYEHLIMSAEIASGCNPDVAKVMLVLTTISSQLKSLTAEGWSSLDKIILYGEGIDEDRLSIHLTEGKGHLEFAFFLHHLYDMDDFLDKCAALLSHTMLQLTAVFKDNKPQVVSTQGLYLPSIFREMSYLLALLAVMDEIISGQTLLQEHWAKYKRMIRSVRADTASFGVDAANLAKLELDLEKLDKKLLSARAFQNATENVLNDFKKNGGRISASFTERAVSVVTNWCLAMEKEFADGSDELKPIAVSAFFGFLSVIVPCFDSKKLFCKVVWESLRKIPAVYVGGNYLWMPEKFFTSLDTLWSVKLLDNKLRQNVNAFRFTYLDQRISGLMKDVLNYHLLVSQWCTKLQETFYSKDSSELTREDLLKRCNLLLNGIKLVVTMSQAFKILINLHATLSKPVTKHVVSNLCRILELIKMMECATCRFNAYIAESTSTILQNLSYISLSNVIKLKNYFLSTRDAKRTDDTRLDSIAVLTVMDYCLRGSPTEKRVAVCKLGMEWIQASSKLWKEEDDNGVLATAIDRMQQLLQMKSQLKKAFDCSGVYWHRIILSSYFSSAYENRDASRVGKFFMVLNDCYEKLQSGPHSELARTSFKTEIENCIRTNLVEKICRDVEVQLRLASHSHLYSSIENVANVCNKAPTESLELKHVLNASSFQFHDCKFKLKSVIEEYLSKVFYNYASVALHDWYSYAKMRVLAKAKYNLQILADHLPGHSLEQGLDVLEIAKNLNNFVQEFSYNLNNQVFVQVTSLSKHVDTVNIRHIANSLRTHGPGITCTLINTVFIFLQTKIRKFSQFLFDEQIRSRLGKEIKVFKQSAVPTNMNTDSVIGLESLTSIDKSQSKRQNVFSYDRALKFQKGIRKLGLSQEGASQLDLFRLLVTHIGNSLGFVRLIRSGGLNFLATECRFIPQMNDHQAEEYLHKLSRMRDSKTYSSQNFVATLDSLTSAVTDSVDYLKLLVQGFMEACRDPRHFHLRYFYAIVPALTLSYIDHIRSSKEKLIKKTVTSHTLFTDDGFAMGVAFLLKVLGQDEDFDSLQWFVAVRTHLQEEKNVAELAVQAAKNEKKLQQANALTVKRIQDMLQEFQLFAYNFNSARIFFR